MAITLRTVDPEDRPFLLQVYAATREPELAQTPWTSEQRAAFVFMQFEAQDSFYREQYPDADYKVILREGEPVGRLYVRREEDVIHIIDIAVLPEYRNRGIGSELTRGILNEAIESGRSVQIYVETYNPSLELFKKLGFSILREEGINYLLEWNVAKTAIETT
jgi:ribosomal protein S18 acetylase RimI-like enzyme